MQGGLSFRAIRLTTSFMELYRSGNFSAESIAKADLTAVDIFQEVPIQFHNTALIRALLHDYDMGNKLNCDFERLNLTCACALLRACLRISPSARAGSMRQSPLWLQARHGVDSAVCDAPRRTNPFLEKNLEFLIDCIDELAVELNKFQYHQRSVQRIRQQQEAYLAKKRQENQARRLHGQEPMPDEDTSNNPLFKPIPEQSRLESLLITNQVHQYCQQINTFAGQSFSKLFLLGGLQPKV